MEHIALPGLARLSALLLVLLPAACDGVEPAAQAFHPVQRPALRLAPGVAAAPAPRTWLSLDLAQPGAFQIDGVDEGCVPDPGSPSDPALRQLAGEADKTIRIPLAVAAGRLDRVHVRVHVDRFDLLEMRWSKAGKPQGSTETQLFPESHTATYVLERPISVAADLDEVELVFHGKGALQVGRVDFEELALAQRLPQPPAEPAWVRASEDVRCGWGLVTRAPLEVDFEPPPDAILVASALVPQALRVPGSEPVLAMTLTGATEEPRVHRWPLVTSESLSSEWVWIRVPLAGMTGRRVTARFELLTSGADAICALSQPQIVQFDDSAPTVLLITSDTHRGDYLGCVPESSGVATPVLDQFAAEGVLFEHCQSATNVTIPSHSAIMTGVSPRDSGLLDNLHSLSPEARTLAERFRELGWATVAAVSATHLDAEWSGLGQGFDRVAVSLQHKREAGATLSHVEDWLSDYRGRPLFVWLHVFDAHTPYKPPAPFDARYWPQKTNPWDQKLPEPPPNSIPIYLRGLRDVDWLRARYMGEVGYLDSELARLFQRPRFQKAIVAFTADHGESLGGHGVWWDHAGMYQDSLHVPLILRWPGGPCGVRVTERVTNLDLARTLLDLAGMPRGSMPGHNLLDTLEQRRTPPEPVFGLACFGLSASITEGDEHLVLHLRDFDLAPGVPRARHAVEFFDLAKDPGCTADLSAERRVRARELRLELIAWLRAAERRDWSRLPQGSGSSVAQIAELGYTQSVPREDGQAYFPAHCACPNCKAFE